MGALQDKIRAEAFSFMDGGSDPNKKRLIEVYLQYDKKVQEQKDQSAYSKMSEIVLNNDDLGEYMSN